KWLLGVYTARFNRKRKLFGHLFSGRYKALVVDGSGNGYLKSVCDWRKGHPFKIKLATQLRTETTVTVSWLAQRLSMGSRGHLAHLLVKHSHVHTESNSTNQMQLEI